MDFPSAVLLELELSAGVWTSVSADLRGPIHVERGIPGVQPSDRCAGTGVLTCTLNNAATNSGGKVGFYSPGHGNCRAGFALGIGIRLRITATGPSGPETVAVWTGRITRIGVQPGSRRERAVAIEAVDWMDEAARANLRSIDAQENQNALQLATAVVAGVDNAPTLSGPGTGGESTFRWALDSDRDEQTKVLTVLQHIACSEVGQIYLSGAGQIVVQHRHFRIGPIVSDPAWPVLTLDETMAELQLTESREDLLNRIQVTVHPREVDTAATTVLYDLQTTPSILPGQTLTLLGPYGDPNNGNARCGGTDMVDPVAGTDYTMDSVAEGTLGDLTASCTVTAAYGSNGVRWTITNNASVVAFITTLQCRGRGIYARQALVAEASDTSAIDAYGETVGALDMTYEDDAARGQMIADWLVSFYGGSPIQARGVRYLANALPTGTVTHPVYSGAVDLDISDVVALTETVTGLSAAKYFIQRITLDIDPKYYIWVTLLLAPADTNTYWALGHAGMSELQATTTLGPL